MAVINRSVWDLNGIYENSFNKLSEKFFAKSAWPSAESVANAIGDEGLI
jgi:translation initiation factor 3 subunit L